MREFFSFIVLGFAMFALSGCVSPSSVDQGQEAVLVYQPWFFGHGGVEQTPIKTGQVWTMFSTKVIRVNTKPYLIDEKFNDLITFDNNPVDFKFHFIFQNIEGQTPRLVEKFGVGENGGAWYFNNLREPVRNMARDFTKSRKMFEMTTDKPTVDAMQERVAEEVRKLLKDKQIPVVLVSATVGKVYPPAKVVEATIATAVQKQNVKTQHERVKAEEARKKAEVASAAADKAYAEEFGMTPAQFLQLRGLENQRAAIDAAAEGKATLNLIMGGEPKPMINLK